MHELRELTAHAENRRTETGIPRVVMVRGEIPEHRLSAVYEPMINIIVSGGKTLTIGEHVHHYNPSSYFVMTVEVPATGVVHSGGPGQPYVGVSLAIEPTMVAALLVDIPEPLVSTRTPGSFSVCSMTPELLDAWARMLRLMRTPSDIPILAPTYEREILYRVLQGPLGWLLRDIGQPGSATAQIRQAIRWIRDHWREPFHVEDLARTIGMSASAFHRHFKTVTTMSPIQYQKRLRLVEARTLLVSQAQNATTVAFAVGYESASQFSREYARLFGVSPAKDALAHRTR